MRFPCGMTSVPTPSPAITAMVNVCMGLNTIVARTEQSDRASSRRGRRLRTGGPPHSLLIWDFEPQRPNGRKRVRVVAGVDLGGTAINYTLMNGQEFLIEGLFEHPALSKQGPEVCLRQIEDGLKLAVEEARVLLSDVVAVGLDTTGPSIATGVLRAGGST